MITAKGPLTPAQAEVILLYLEAVMHDIQAQHGEGLRRLRRRRQVAYLKGVAERRRKLRHLHDNNIF